MSPGVARADEKKWAPLQCTPCLEDSFKSMFTVAARILGLRCPLAGGSVSLSVAPVCYLLLMQSSTGALGSWVRGGGCSVSGKEGPRLVDGSLVGTIGSR